MIEVSSNMQEVILSIKDKMDALKDPSGMLQTVALAVLPEMRKRVHVEGHDSSGSQIGTYSPEYMKVRTGDYSNSKRVTRGVNKGKAKDAGQFTKGGKQNTPRPKYHRSADTKVILSLTRQMENDMSVVATGNGYGIGYKNPFNHNKAIWNEKRYNKKILTTLTQEELELVDRVAEEYVSENIK